MSGNIYIDNVRDDDHVELTENEKAYVVVRNGKRLLVSWKKQHGKESQKRLSQLVKATRRREK